MNYKYKQLDAETYTSSLYTDGLKKSKLLEDSAINETISNIGLFKFKGYVKAFRDKLTHYSIDDILFLYRFDRELSVNMFTLVSSIEIKIKTYLIETVYGLTDNPFCYYRCAHNGRICSKLYEEKVSVHAGTYRKCRNYKTI